MVNFDFLYILFKYSRFLKKKHYFLMQMLYKTFKY